MTTNDKNGKTLTGERVEEVSNWADRLVLYGVFQKNQDPDGKERYYLTSQFKHHIKQFGEFMDSHPDLQPDTLSQFAMLNLMMYLAINRKLDQLPFYHMKSSMKMAEVFNEIDAMLDKMTDDSELEELQRMSELVFMHMKMNIENKLPD